MRAGRRTIAISNPGKVMYPGDGITKEDVVSYYRSVAHVMLPQVRDRLLTMERFPDGITSRRFFQKDIPGYFPAWVKRKTVPKRGGEVTHVVGSDTATLVYLANQACLTLHASLSRTESLERPDQMVFDLDPSAPGFEEVRWAALELRAMLGDLGLVPFVKTTGSRGLHVVAPLDGKMRFQEVRPIARAVAAVFAAEHPHRNTIEQRKLAREGRLYVDWTRNTFGQTAVAPYSLRARPGATAAVPVHWEEVEDPGFDPSCFTIHETLARVKSGMDPWKGWRRRARSAARAARALAM